MTEIPEYKIFNFGEVAAALKKVRDQYLAGEPLVWTGPERLHYKIGATDSPPEWHFSPEGLEHHDDQGRDFWDVYTQVTFQIGAHNGIMMMEPEIASMRRLMDMDRMLLAAMTKAEES